MELQMFSASMGAMGSLLGKVRSLLVSQDQLAERLKPHKDKIELLKQDLEEISSLLMDLSRVEAPNAMVKLWMNEARDLSYDIEDSIDKAMPPSNTGEENPFDVDEFNTLLRQASDARKRHHRYDLGRWASNSNPAFGVEGQIRVASTDLFGIGDSMAKLINLLSNDAEQRLKVVSVFGAEGVGKTTIATEVYRKMRGKFECGAFVRASRMPDTRRLLQSIISQVRRHQLPPHGLPVQELIDNIREHLQQKSYFILIDGLWETTSWDIIHSAFPEGTHCSRILVTTHIEDVAMECCDYQSDGIFKIEPLSDSNSRELLFNRLFGSKHQYSEQLKEVSEQVIRKCGGLPLATICIASILATQQDNSELWRHVNEYLSCSMRNNLASEGMLREIVGLSYNSLRDHLKTCLLYLSMYPEGYTFFKADLVKQWSAEGFVNAVEGTDTTEVAEFYFDELVCRGLIQPNCIDYSEEVIFYTVHSTVFEVIRCKSINKNFTTVMDYSEAITKLSAKVRRLSLTFSSAKYATKPEGVTPSAVRSLTFYGLFNCLPSVMEFNLLRVLILEFWSDKKELDIRGINKLFQLRYLRITTGMTIKLPASMQELLYLETLEVYARVTIFPSDAFALPRLLHLCLQEVINLPYGIGQMKSLRTLQSFDLSRNSNNNVWALNEMTNLRDLHLTCSTSTASSEHHLKRNLIALVSSLEKLGNLKSIILAPAASCTTIDLCCSSNVFSLPVSLQKLQLLPPICMFSRLPVWIGQLQKLHILEIVLRQLTRGDVDNIGRLQELSILSLYIRQPTTELIVIHHAEFPVLKCFKFRCGVMRLAFQAGAMPSLRRLKLEFNAHSGEQNGNMLSGVEHLLNLQEITGRIGAPPGVEESDRMAAESVFKDAISKHSRLTSFNLRIVHLFDEEISQVADTPASCSDSVKKLSWPSMADDISELHKEAAQELSPFVNASSMSNTILPKYQMMAPAEEAFELWIEDQFGDKALRNQESDGNAEAFSTPVQPIWSNVGGSNTLSQRQSTKDGYNWRKYGQKQVEGNENRRSYYKCTFPGCLVKRKVERSQDGQIVEIVYKGNHNHARPQNTQFGGTEASGSTFSGMSGITAVTLETSDSESFGNDETWVSSPNSEFDENDLADSKRLREDSEDEGISSAGKRMMREPWVNIVKTISDVDIMDDGCGWRKYGQKNVQGNPAPRSYYKCATIGCPARKQVERSPHDTRVVITYYEGKHSHDVPPSRTPMAYPSCVVSTPDGLVHAPAAGGAERRHHARVEAKEEFENPSASFGSGSPLATNSSGEEFDEHELGSIDQAATRPSLVPVAAMDAGGRQSPYRLHHGQR